MITRRTAIGMIPTSLITASSIANGAMALSLAERTWLANARAHLLQIGENRIKGAPGNHAYCIFDVADVYVQFLAPFDKNNLYCEAVSAKSAPTVATMLTPIKERLLYELGFNPVENATNYWQKIAVNSLDDIDRCAQLAFRTLHQVYGATDFSSATFELNIPHGG
jgi:hypothetical protein